MWSIYAFCVDEDVKLFPPGSCTTVVCAD